jgi:hypothetical protein
VWRKGKRHGHSRSERAVAQRAPVSGTHREDLEAHMDLLRMAIELEGPCDYGDAPGASPQHQIEFLAHFGELEPQLAEWNDSVERVRAAPTALWSWFEHTARKRGVTEPPFALGPLIDRFAILTAERSRRGQLSDAHKLHVEHFRDRIGGAERISLHVEGQNVAKLPSAPEPTAAERTADAEAMLQRLFDDAQRSDPASEIQDSRDALLDQKQPLLDLLAILASVDTIAFAPDCPECSRAFAAEQERAAQQPATVAEEAGEDERGAEAQLGR